MTEWRKSRRSGTASDSDCVEVADLAGNIGVRDSKNPAGPRLTLDAHTWRAFTRRVKDCRYDLI